MMTVLLESAGGRGPRRTVWTAASAGAHVALIAFAAVATLRAPAGAVIDEPVPEQPIFIPMEDPARPRNPQPPQAPRFPATPIGQPALPTISVVPTIDPTVPFAPAPISADELFALRAARDTVPGAGNTGVFTHGTVERTAMPLPGNGAPDYPRHLRTAGVEGSVVVTFVVDVTGRADAGSITIVAATHPSFADAVRQWLRRTRYAPAEINREPVRQLVQQEVGFTLER